MTWSLPKLPAQGVTEPEAIRLPDHRLAYLDYEGPVSGDRGQVKRIDRGDYVVVEETAEWLHVRLAGTTAVSEVRLPIAPPPQAMGSTRSS
jgi:hypothetical protein